MSSLKVKLHFSGPLFSAAMTGFFGAIDLIRFGLTLEAEQERALLSKAPKVAPHIAANAPSQTGLNVLLDGEQFVKSDLSPQEFWAAYPQFVAPCLAFAQRQLFESEPDARQAITIISLAPGSLEGELADAIDSILERLRRFFSLVDDRLRRPQVLTWQDLPRAIHDSPTAANAAAVRVGCETVLRVASALECTKVEATLTP